jgi:hypothetical protein
MKTWVTIFALLALAVGVPASAEENAPLPAPSGLAAFSAPACSSVAAGTVPSPQKGELPSWLTSEPLIWTGEVESLAWFSTGCAKYCAECGGC